MVYAKIKNNELIEYPYGFAQLQADNPYTNYGGNHDVFFWFPQTNSAIENGYTLVEVKAQEKPIYNPATSNCVLATKPVFLSGQWVLVWSVIPFTEEDQIAYNEKVQEDNKLQATQLLQSTDWACTVDIANPQYTNPYLINQDEFLSYRSQVRKIAVNPPSELVTFPDVPKAVWVNATQT